MTRDPAATREKILDAATRAFGEGGFGGTTVRTIASGAGVNVATLAYHFGDKQGLYDAVVARYFGNIARSADALPSGDGDWVRVLVTGVWSGLRGQRDGVRILIRHALDHGGLGSGPARAALAEFTEQVGRRAGLEPDRARLAVNTFAYLATRYGVNSEAELCRLTGVDDAEVAEVRIVEHLVSVARLLLHATCSEPS